MAVTTVKTGNVSYKKTLRRVIISIRILFEYSNSSVAEYSNPIFVTNPSPRRHFGDGVGLCLWVSVCPSLHRNRKLLLLLRPLAELGDFGGDD